MQLDNFTVSRYVGIKTKSCHYHMIWRSFQRTVKLLAYAYHKPDMAHVEPDFYKPSRFWKAKIRECVGMRHIGSKACGTFAISF
jgi:hypothetical protein